MSNGNLVFGYNDREREELDFVLEKWRFIEEEFRFAESGSIIADFVRNKTINSGKPWIAVKPSSSLCSAITDSFI